VLPAIITAACGLAGNCKAKGDSVKGIPLSVLYVFLKIFLYKDVTVKELIELLLRSVQALIKF